MLTVSMVALLLALLVVTLVVPSDTVQ